MARTRGFVLGKFMPLHAGHVFMLDVAAGLVDELTVLVCTRDCEPIDGELRSDWVLETGPRNMRVVHFTKDVPQEPADHPDFWNIWQKIIRESHPEQIDMLFGSEPYVLKLAELMKAKPFLVDPERRVVPVSATSIRRDPAANWHHIPSAVRPYYQQRICLLGPESSGKSTLAAQLSKAHEAGLVHEYGRDYDAQFKQGKDWGCDDFLAIARGHIALRKAIATRSGPWLFEDTDLLQTLIWAEFLLGSAPDPLSLLLDGFEAAQHYLVLSPDVTWVDDGTRYSSSTADRAWFFERALELLKGLNLPYSVISGTDWEERFSQAKAVIERLSIQP